MEIPRINHPTRKCESMWSIRFTFFNQPQARSLGTCSVLAGRTLPAIAVPAAAAADAVRMNVRREREGFEDVLISCLREDIAGDNYQYSRAIMVDSIPNATWANPVNLLFTNIL